MMRLHWFLIAVLTASTAQAGTMDDPEISDETGDVQVAGVGTPAADSLDLVKVWFAAGEPGDCQAGLSVCHHGPSEATRVWVELSAFQRVPNVVYRVEFQSPEGSAWVGYGFVLGPDGPQDMFYGCISGDQHGVPIEGTPSGARHGDCQELSGRVDEGVSRFAVEVPTEWTPAGARLVDATAHSYWMPLGVPEEAGAAWGELAWVVQFDTAGPGRAYLVPSGDRESAPAPVAFLEPAVSSGAPALGVLIPVAVLVLAGAVAYLVWRLCR